MEREVWVSAAQAGNEMIFESADGSLSGIATVDMWRCQLEINGL